MLQRELLESKVSHKEGLGYFHLVVAILPTKLNSDPLDSLYVQLIMTRTKLLATSSTKIGSDETCY